MSRRKMTGPCLGLLLAVPALAQETPLFTTGTNSVQVEAAVATSQRPTPQLKLEDFVLLDNGQPRPITAIVHDDVPLDIVLVCQSPLQGFGARVRYNLNRDGTETLPATTKEVALPPDYADPRQRASQRLMASATFAVSGLRPGDRVGMVTYGKDPRIALRFTPEAKSIAAAIKRLGDPENADENIVLTSEGLAIEYAVRMIEDVERADPAARTARRRLIVMISSILGSGTHYVDEPIIRRLWDRDIVLSVIDDAAPTPATTTVQRSDGGDSQTILFRRYNPIHIAQATGGDRIVALEAQHPGDLLTPIRQRYTLWFNQPPDAPPGESRSIQVDLSGDARRRVPDAVIRAREGYVPR